MRNLSAAEFSQVSGGKKSRITPTGPKTKALPVQATHGQETALLASNKPKKAK